MHTNIIQPLRKSYYMYNSVTLVGNLGQDPESRTLDGGSTVCRLSLATSRSWKNAQGEKKEQTEWHNVVLWNKLGEIAQQYLSKGSKVLITGRIAYRTQENPDGTKRYYTDIVATEMKMIGTKQNDSRFPSEAPARPSAAAVQNSTAAQFADAKVEKGYGDLPF